MPSIDVPLMTPIAVVRSRAPSLTSLRSGWRRDPQHVGATAIVGDPRGDEQIVGQAVDVRERGRADRLDRGERCHAPLGAPADDARLVQRRRRARPARQHERAQRREVGVERIDLAFEPLDLARRDAQARVLFVWRGGAQRSAPRSKRSFCARASVASIAASAESPDPRLQPRQADRAIGFVDRAERFDPRVVLGAARTVARPVVPSSPVRV